MAFCWCPPGTFQMGSPASEQQRGDDEDPVQVALTQGFWLGKFPVTQREYEQLTGTLTGTFTSTGYMKDAVKGLDTSRFPVERITWDEAVAFCQSFTKQERKAGRLPANWEYRLPTEAQWEYACRAGTTTATAFGDKLSSKQANFDGTQPYNRAAKGPNLARPTTVGSYPANAWGLHDLHGNVRELCRDAVAPKLPGGTDPEVLPTKPIGTRIVRGGSWYHEGAECRSAFRYGMMNTVFDDTLGFRVACVRIA
jgi:formylglycine-generating enzyme required for sulfatase activity